MNITGQRQGVPGFVNEINSSATRTLLPGVISFAATVDSQSDTVPHQESQMPPARVPDRERAEALL
jgi:hypothetical protein